MELPITCIKAGCPEGGIVLDPFFGSGTTGLAAQELSRHWVGIELNEEPLKNFSQTNTKIFYGSQTDIPFLNSIISKIGKVDVIIDDGGHTNNQLLTSFNYLFEYGLKPNGLYVMEDLGTSYWYKWSGGLNNDNSIINFLKQKVDGINYRFWKGNRNDFTPKPIKSLVDSTYQDENILSITFMKGLSFIKKGNNNTGNEVDCTEGEIVE